MSEHSQEHQEFASEEARAENIKVGISRVIDSLPFKSNPDLTRRDVVTKIAEKFLEAGHQIALSDRGWVIGTDRTGKQLDLSEEVSEALLTDQHLCDAESVSAAVESGALGVQAKSDLRTTEQKVRYVRKFGEEAFAKLPTHRTPKVDTNDVGHLTAQQWKNLPLSERARISGLIGDEGVGQILARK